LEFYPFIFDRNSVKFKPPTMVLTVTAPVPKRQGMDLMPVSFFKMVRSTAGSWLPVLFIVCGQGIVAANSAFGAEFEMDLENGQLYYKHADPFVRRSPILSLGLDRRKWAPSRATKNHPSRARLQNGKP
jgi:hypothetical protein